MRRARPVEEPLPAADAAEGERTGMAIRDVGLAVVRRLPWLKGAARRAYGLLPAALHDHPARHAQRFFRGEAGVTIVQVGAFDGLAGDPVRPLLRDNPGWTGVLVEPQPAAFARLRATYAGEGARLQFVNAAVSDRAGQRAFHTVSEAAVARLGLPDWSREIASFDRAHLQRHLPGVELTESLIDVVTFADVAGRLPQGRADLVVLDVEGHEGTLLRGIDFDGHAVRYVIFEHKHMDDGDYAAVRGELAGRGFVLKRYGRDTVAWRMRVPGAV